MNQFTISLYQGGTNFRLWYTTSKKLLMAQPSTYLQYDVTVTIHSALCLMISSGRLDATSIYHAEHEILHLVRCFGETLHDIDI